jgi:hypothetical protein
MNRTIRQFRAAAFTNQAIDEANRAVQELLLLQGLT